MITRLRVDGFKNLVNFEIHFGAVTCIAGVNAVGKSNIFDAINFLHRLADLSLIDAALGVRNNESQGDIRRLFHRGPSGYTDQMSFEVDMIIPPRGVDDLGQDAEATATFLRYQLSLGWRDFQMGQDRPPLHVLAENLTHIPKGQAAKHLHFPHSKTEWRDHVVTGKGTGHRSAPFISTVVQGDKRVVQLHQDGQGKPRPFPLDNFPRTLLSTATMADGPTVSLVRQEMRSWMQLQLEPSSLRKPSEMLSPKKLQADGSGLAAALYRLARLEQPHFDGPLLTSAQVDYPALADTSVCTGIASRLSALIGGVDRVWVEEDPKRQLLTLMLRQSDGAEFPASSLSDGTLRFLALALLAEDASSEGPLCLEEPENGLHPGRIPQMLQLLESYADNPKTTNPSGSNLRQVIFNTHSPGVFNNVNYQDLVFAVPYYSRDHGRILELACMPGSWRAKFPSARLFKPGLALDYLQVPIEGRPTVSLEDTVSRQLSLNLEPAA